MLPIPPPFEPVDLTDEAIANPRSTHSIRPRQSAGQVPESFPEVWRAFLRSNVCHYEGLSKSERKRLHHDTQIFIAEKNWEGCRGLSVTDEMKVTIAAQACLMLLGQEHNCFGRVRSILIYPSEFRTVDEYSENEGWLPMAAGGQAIYQGPVILAWDTVLAEGRDRSSRGNIVIHEFAHQLDFVDGYADGTLDLAGEQGDRWDRLLTSEFKQLRRELRQGRETLFGDYAASSKTELFATASERFFTQPATLRQLHPLLYKMLKVIYAVNPLKWFPSAGEPTDGSVDAS